MAAPDGRFVRIDWVEANRESIRLIDVREEWEYRDIGHIPGAVNIPFDVIRADDERDIGMLPGADAFARGMGDAGIAPTDVIVVYDDETGVFASRFVVTAELYNHTTAYVLDGDYSAWSRVADTTTDVPAVEPVEYDITGPFDRPLIDADGVIAAIGEAGTVIVDTRTPEEFASGHIEGAVNLDWRELVDQTDRTLKDRDEIESILSSYGITPETRVVLYCNTARRMSHTYLVLRHLGYDEIAFYEGSLRDWNAHEYELVASTDT